MSEDICINWKNLFDEDIFISAFAGIGVQTEDIFI